MLWPISMTLIPASGFTGELKTGHRCGVQELSSALPAPPILNQRLDAIAFHLV